MRVEMRSTAGDEATLDLFPELPRRPQGHPDGGVGARQARRAARRGGGGYLNGRTASELRTDLRLRELAEIGLSATWLAIAAAVGYETFVVIWRTLSADDTLRNEHNQIELVLRPFRSYERYQRNRYVATLAQAGLKPAEIEHALRADLGERLSRRHIHRLVADSRPSAAASMKNGPAVTQAASSAAEALQCPP
jgi:hypothetical protein